jgi:Stress responsive A/B Barrel Domain
MIRHCVFVTLAPDTSEAATAAIVDALRGLPDEIPEIRTYEVGVDLGWREGNPDIGMVVTFDDEDAWRTYQQHPAHIRAIEEHIAPHAAGRSSVQFEI